MVDAARQMLDELMGRNRNLHPSEAARKINWDDPEFCQYHIVKFCPHDLFINTRADLGPCQRLHDDEAKLLYEQARPTARKRQYEDEFLRFCSTMLNDVDRKIQKGKQRLQLMHRDHPGGNNPQHVSKFQEQVNNLNARIKKLLSEAEEAGIRGDVDQAQDLMTLCDQLKEEKEKLIAQHEINTKEFISVEPLMNNEEKSPKSEENEKKLPWVHDLGTLPEKQMEVCEICGAFLIVGDAQQRIEDHLMGKQHLGYSRLRSAVEEIHEKRQKEREEEDRKRREERSKRSNNIESSRRREPRNYRENERDHDRRHRENSRDPGSYYPADKSNYYHLKKIQRRRSRSRSCSSSSRNHRRNSRDRNSRSRSRSNY